MQALSAEWTGLEVAGLKVVAVTGTGILVTLATGGTGLIPYAARISAATGASIRASYHLPFVGTSRNIYAAYQQGAVLGMGFHVSLLSVEAFGLGRGVIICLKGQLRQGWLVRGMLVSRGNWEQGPVVL